MPVRNPRLAAWFRTDDGKIVLATVALAVLTALVWGFVSLRNWDQNARETALLAQLTTSQARMLRDLHAGMNHSDFLRKYGKAIWVQGRPDGLQWLHYDGLAVTFKRSGELLEVQEEPLGLRPR